MASAQLGLFEVERPAPEGLRAWPDVVSAQEEEALIAQIRALPLAPFQLGAYQGKRRVASFGWRYDYGAQRLEQAAPLPAWLAPAMARAEALAGLPAGAVGQALCTEYEIGAGIGWHRDRPHFDRVLGLSLGSACKVRFRRRRGAGWERFSLQTEPRSLYLMTGESRHVWEHSIAPVEAPRYSITLRTMAAR